MMKIRIITLFVFALLVSTQISTAQSGWGIMGGLTFPSSGNLIDETSEIIDSNGSNNTGFNIGLFAKADLGLFYIRPELLYSQYSITYKAEGQSSDYKESKIDVPVLVGLRIIGPLKLFLGPDFQFILNNDLDGFQFSDIENDFTVGGNIGLAVALGRFEVDLRYERGFSENEVAFINKNITEIPEARVDARSEQMKLNLSYRF